MTSDELRPLRELAEIFEREGRFADASCIWLLFLEIDRLTRSVAELERPAEQWEVVERRDGWVIGKCPLCERETRIGEYDE